MLAERLSPGGEIRVIAPSTSLALVKGKQIELAESRLRDLGFHITYGKNVENHDEFFSTSIEERIEDLHDAFRSPSVKGILTASGGYNANQLLKYIDYECIQNNPKVFCGFGDITALNLAIYHKTGLINYSGPHFSTLGIKHEFQYTLNSFLNAVTNDAPFEISPSSHWSDDPWHLEEEDRTFIEQDGYFVIQEGEAEGKLVGGNLSTLNLLQGTAFMPSLKNAILFIEDDEESHPLMFERDLQSLLHLPDANKLKAILIGRFQKGSNVTDAALKKIIQSKRELKDIPIIGNVNFGHTTPLATIPIGAKAAVSASENDTEIFIEQI
ncbi:S66 family peptidase [Bacillus dakarensis]|uniref:S66 family peptidase n=1 Tax=Robertmurraya dakarensis TaxID=1926278 RepID=UPI000981899F|nr:S66 peptidase family protein [Bacillus dakarensis]